MISESLNANKSFYQEGSFRDPEGRVFITANGVFRSLSLNAVSRMRQLLNSNFIVKLIAEGLVIPTKMVETKALGLSSSQFGDYVLEHEKISLVTYPYEWSFDMLRDAALTQLTIMEMGLNEGYILKDGTAFNNLYRNGKMCFIDILSVDSYVEGQPWEGYSQFCQEFLLPLMLTSYKNIEFQPWWRGTMKGITLSEFNSLLKFNDYFRRGVLKHIVLQNIFESSFSKSRKSLYPNFQNNVFSKQSLKNLLSDLKSVIENLSYKHSQSKWVTYANDNSYLEADKHIKENFVRDCIKQITPNQIIDIGSNTGLFSKIISEYATKVISIDLDPSCINNLYLELSKNADLSKKIIPVIGDLINPTPAQGWELAERDDLFLRVRSNAFVALAVVHHICIGSNVPLDYFVSLLKKIANSGVVEWVDSKDIMVSFMLRNRKNIFSNYTWEKFKTNIEKHFTVLKIVDLHNGSRKLCFLGPK